MASNTNIGASQQGPGQDIGASQTAVAVPAPPVVVEESRRNRTLFLFSK